MATAMAVSSRRSATMTSAGRSPHHGCRSIPVTGPVAPNDSMMWAPSKPAAPVTSTGPRGEGSVTMSTSDSDEPVPDRTVIALHKRGSPRDEPARPRRQFIQQGLVRGRPRIIAERCHRPVGQDLPFAVAAVEEGASGADVPKIAGDLRRVHLLHRGDVDRDVVAAGGVRRLDVV